MPFFCAFNSSGFIISAHMTNSSPLYLGIDTGGTFTDGVLLDPQLRQVVKKIKAPTTHFDLRICISEVLEKLVPPDPSRISLVSLSTTLATNAIAEGKRKPVALMLLGYDEELVYNYNFHKGFSTKQYFFISGRHDLDGVEQMPLDEEALLNTAAMVQKDVEAFAVASYAGPIDSSHEIRAEQILTKTFGLPVVQAHHLSTELDSIRRATTASLNASLLSNLQEFLAAVSAMLAQKGVYCPVLMVRGDASLVRSEFALHRPVEAIHSGPATSAIGGQFLAGVDEALVVDIGGTTTDISFVSAGKVQIQDHAATIGDYRTCVKTIQARSLGLGGDSLVHFDHWQALSLGPERVIPLSRMCSQYPEVKRDLLGWLHGNSDLPYSERLEYWMLRREPLRPIQDERTRQAIELLKSGPRRVADLLRQVGARSAIQLSVQDLINAEVIDRVGLTPTDLLHLTGEFALWDAEGAERVVEVAARQLHLSPKDFIQRIFGLITRQIAAEIIEFLSGKLVYDRTSRIEKHDLGGWLFDESLAGKDPILGCNIFLKVPLIGIGAPAHAFLPAVAEVLGTEILLPEHYEVANAVGTVVGNVVIQEKGEVFPHTSGAAVLGYFARIGNSQVKFRSFDEALAYARQAITSLVGEQAKAAGAVDFEVECQERFIWDGMVDLNAWAVGKPA